jgi:hypothetical protein
VIDEYFYEAKPVKLTKPQFLNIKMNKRESLIKTNGKMSRG